MSVISRKIIKHKCNCIKEEIYLEFDFSLKIEYLQIFIKENYKTKQSYINSGILYIEDTNLIAMAPIGTNRLKIKCKNKKCLEDLDRLEQILRDLNEQQIK